MNYVIQEPILTTISNEEIESLEAKRALLQSIYDKQYNIQLYYEDSSNMDFIKAVEKARITAVGETTIDIHMFLSKATMKCKGIPIDNIKKIKLIATKDMLDKKYKVNRWHNIDVAEIG